MTEETIVEQAVATLSPKRVREMAGLVLVGYTFKYHNSGNFLVFAPNGDKCYQGQSMGNPLEFQIVHALQHREEQHRVGAAK